METGASGSGAASTPQIKNATVMLGDARRLRCVPRAADLDDVERHAQLARRQLESLGGAAGGKGDQMKPLSPTGYLPAQP